MQHPSYTNIQSVNVLDLDITSHTPTSGRSNALRRSSLICQLVDSHCVHRRFQEGYDLPVTDSQLVLSL